MRPLFGFSRGEMRGILWLLPLLAVIEVVIAAANRPQFEKSFLEQVEEDISREDTGYADAGRTNAASSVGDVVLFEFDPNTVTLQELCMLGFSTRTAAGIIKYRERGKRFEIPEDFASCYGVGIEQYTRLEPYINIGMEYRMHRNGGSVSVRSGTASTQQRNVAKGARGEESGAQWAELREFDPNRLDADGFTELGFSPAQAAAIIKYRTAIGGFRTAEDFGKSYVVSPQMLERLSPHISIGESLIGGNVAGDSVAGGNVAGGSSGSAVIAAEPRRLLELNGADSVQLRAVSGIGEALVVRIMDYRERLGGYARIEQLAEIPGMTQENFERIKQQIFVDSCVIQKIDINFASHQSMVDALGNHPYITSQGLRKLLKNRQLKGGWRTIEDMEEQNIVTAQQARRLAPYLIFRTE